MVKKSFYKSEVGKKNQFFAHSLINDVVSKKVLAK